MTRKSVAYGCGNEECTFAMGGVFLDAIFAE